MKIERILAPNPGLYTGPGTNTYLVRVEDAVVILDPGPIDDSHRMAIEDAIGDGEVAAVVVTHTHIDHAPLANPLAERFAAPAIGFAPGPEFDPDQLVRDGDTIPVGTERLEVLYTPGHADDHVCLRVGRALFTGDHIMGGSTVMVQDLVKYLASLERLRHVELERLYPGHGPEIDDPAGVIDYYIAHRLEREQQVVEALREGAGSIGEVVRSVYTDVDESLHRIAAYSVGAHIRKLAAEGAVRFDEESAGELWDALVELADSS